MLHVEHSNSCGHDDVRESTETCPIEFVYDTPVIRTKLLLCLTVY
jgi:hypothetical protein